LDKWLNQVGVEKGKEALPIVIAALKNNIRTNLQYYEDLALQLEQSGAPQLGAKHKLMAELYKGLLKKQ